MTSPRTTQATPSKRARLEAIEAGLQARRQPQTDELPFTHGVEQNAVSETNMDTRQQVHERYSFLGLPPTQESEPGGEPSTPKKRPSSSKEERFGLRGATSSSALLTPPQSMKVSTSRVEPFAYAPSGSGTSRPEPIPRHGTRAKVEQIPNGTNSSPPRRFVKSVASHCEHR